METAPTTCNAHAIKDGQESIARHLSAQMSAMKVRARPRTHARVMAILGDQFAMCANLGGKAWDAIRPFVKKGAITERVLPLEHAIVILNGPAPFAIYAQKDGLAPIVTQRSV